MATGRVAVAAAFPLLHKKTLFSVVLWSTKPGNKCCLIILFRLNFLWKYIFCKMQRSLKRRCRPAAVVISRHAQQAGGISTGDFESRDNAALATPTLAAPDNSAPGCTCTSACKTPPFVAHGGMSLDSSPFSTSTLLPSHTKLSSLSLSFTYAHGQRGPLVGEGNVLFFQRF